MQAKSKFGRVRHAGRSSWAQGVNWTVRAIYPIYTESSAVRRYDPEIEVE